ncbi:MAG: nucleoside triphosphate pyrophosphohydrolase [Planctomycetes bacterium]|nr:nucleoside triphosphate pyrophosphohydrolase [Planctomycetota bacterium]
MTLPPDPARRRRTLDALDRLLDVVARLRAPDGCPWDREQSERTMAPHLLEETYEALDAIERGAPAGVREELGDVLMNVLMIAQIASETDRFDTGDVAATIADKLVRRHPHVFGDTVAHSPAEVLANWEQIKRREGGAAPRSALDGVPPALPALLRACRVGEKAARVGFDWPDRDGPRRKVDEELAELDAALAEGDAEAAGRELGDVLFSLCNLARHHGLEPETALRATIERFSRRFRAVEAELGERLPGASLAELEDAWQRAKRSTAT